MKNTVQLTKQLVMLPSFVDTKSNELPVMEFLYRFCSSNPYWKVTMQPVSQGRYNLHITDSYPTRLLFLGHTDTVQPKMANITQLTPVIRNDRLYGLGAADMKGNIAAFLQAWKNQGKTRGISALLYVDEEYDFLGMKKFVETIDTIFKPELLLSGDGTDLQLGNACRGVIELFVAVRGRSGHASTPTKGINAITRSYASIWRLQKYLQKFCKDPILGKSTINVAYLRGGLFQGVLNGDTTLSMQGNSIPDYAEFVIDIRQSTKTMNATRITSLLKGFAQDEGLTIITMKIRHDLGVWNTEKTSLEEIGHIVQSVTPLRYSEPASKGFIDVQLIAERFPAVPCCTIGAGDGNSIHREDENVPLDQLRQIEEIYEKIICWKGGEKDARANIYER